LLDVFPALDEVEGEDPPTLTVPDDLDQLPGVGGQVSLDGDQGPGLYATGARRASAGRHGEYILAEPKDEFHRLEMSAFYLNDLTVTSPGARRPGLRQVRLGN
jgi:hypothetical protein